MKHKKILHLTLAVVITECAGAIGSIVSFPAISTWYATVQKPALNPPNWIFGPVWTALFFLMGISAFLIWNKGFAHKKIKTALSIFSLQLILNMLWSMIFFGLHSPFYAFIDLLILWLAILWTIVVFHRISKSAAMLLVPYLLWVTFAGYLNYEI